MLFEKLKLDRIQAMKDKDVIKKDLLGTLIAEASKEVKEPADDKVIATIKKFIANLKQITGMGNIGQLEALLAKTQKEIAILESYMPKQLSEFELEQIIKNLYKKSMDNPSEPYVFITMGEVMKHLKENYAGLYDGKLANEICKRVLSK